MWPHDRWHGRDRTQQNYYVYFQVDGKPVRTPVIIGASDDTHTEVLKKYVANANSND